MRTRASGEHDGEGEPAGASPGDGTVAHRERTGRRRRAGRRSLQAVVVLPVVAAVGVGLWFGLVDRPSEAPVAPSVPSPTGEPLPAPSPDPTADVAPDPTPHPEPEMPATPEKVDVPGLPPYLEAPDDVLSLATDGWLLSVYQVGDGSRQGWPESVGTVLLTTPTGDHYRLADVAAEWIEVHHWSAGDDRARVTFASDSGGLPEGHATGWLDLRSGEVLADDRPLGGDDFLGLAADGSEVWHSFGTITLVHADGARTEVLADGGGQTAVLNPAGTHVAIEARAGIVLADLDRQRSSAVDLDAAGTDCRAVGWLDDVALLAQCEERAARVTVVGDVSVEPLGDGLAGRYAHQGGVHVTTGSLVLSYWDMAALEADPGLEACAPPAGVWADGRLVEVPAFGATGGGGVRTMAAHDGVVYLGGEHVCSFGEDGPLGELVRLDPRTGAVDSVLPVIDPSGGADGSQVAIGAVVSWVVAR